MEPLTPESSIKALAGYYKITAYLKMNKKGHRGPVLPCLYNPKMFLQKFYRIITLSYLTDLLLKEFVRNIRKE